MADHFDERALELYAAQRASIPAYDAWCTHELAARGSGRAAVRTWRDIPALPIASFKLLDVFDRSVAAVAEWHSSGTTLAERPSRHRLGSLDDYDAAIDAGVRAALLPDVATGSRPPLRCIQMHPSGGEAPHSSLSYMYDRIRTGPWCTDGGAFVDGDYNVDARAAWHALAATADRGEPILLLATSFALAMLLDASEAAGLGALRLAPGSRIVDTGGYKGRTRELTRDELLVRVHARLGVPVPWCENEYGMSELSSQAWLGTVAQSAGCPLQLPAPGARWTPPTLRVRVLDPVSLEEVADGQTGLLAFHDLANRWSCAAVRSEDLGIRRGDGFELVGRAPGATLKGCSLRLEEIA